MSTRTLAVAANTSIVALAGLVSVDAVAQPNATEQIIGSVETVHEFNDAMPTGVTRTRDGRLFVNYPRWGDDVPFTVGEIVGGKVLAYPVCSSTGPTSRTPSAA